MHDTSSTRQERFKEGIELIEAKAAKELETLQTRSLSELNNMKLSGVTFSSILAGSTLMSSILSSTLS